MAGHSKWANIQHRKNRQDAKRGKLFTKLIREITVSARLGGSDPDANPRLRAAIDNALSNNMTKDTVERAIKRGSGEAGGDNVEEVRYEGYGPGGIAVMVDCMTDNRNRTVAEVRHAFSKCGGNLGTDGSVAYLFNKVGLISYPVGTDEDALMEAALEAGAEDIITNDDGSIDVITSPDEFMDIKEKLVKGSHSPETAEITMQASTNLTLDIEAAQIMIHLLDMLEDLDDVQKVYSNADIPEDVLAGLQ
ncbi:MAG: YebC/PmpR family DNA-binding transcriptional regulator [Gammaproteobacteria bacterium]|nr:YebC/PmpR family DNA-binding transcriptional regulator [Gammaproteobacteria bacterium]NIN61716.1 YebC/PmpR family DNA-binding transcriptional regulator [Gammaproteobacteria bacterium]NIO63513.1 YebC/PmpR family DNA-binding transcriptional regulator [Gammaproteobacteria bacterium]NIP48733.1 YebC/PmpR family DNA-binding transcriptional regulator [Gammaproteobacteria bacterium]NIQ09185.1 YebC/PmpR family DNA-binding transcriptional regulator [Gammaproteobacteria bacterium]